MSRFGIAAAALALALLTYFQFPGHTYLQQDSQIYVPILEHLDDPAALRNDPLVERSHVAYTLYDEIALGLRRVTRLGFHEILAAQQIVTRAVGIWGLFLMAQSLGLSALWSVAVAAMVSLGAAIAGPAVLTVEYEPTPRAFALPLVICAMGLAAQGREIPASIAGAVAILYHAPTTVPFWIVFAGVTRNWRAVAPPAIAAVVVAAAAVAQGAPQTPLLATLTSSEEQLLRMRASYIWISTWPVGRILGHLAAGAVLAAALWRVRPKRPLLLFLVGTPVLGLLSMPISWLLLEHYKLWMMPLLQPLRVLLFVTLAMQFASAAAGAIAIGRHWRLEGVVWFALALYPTIQPLWTAPNYPNLHTPELAQLSRWARASTPQDAVFLFPDAGHSLDPGIFRAEALRAIYVDWKSGGQANYLRDFGERWWFRWQQTVGAGFRSEAMPKYEGLGVRYVVVRPENRLGRTAAFENPRYLVYEITSR